MRDAEEMRRRRTERLTEGTAWIGLALTAMPAFTLMAAGCLWIWRMLT